MEASKINGIPMINRNSVVVSGDSQINLEGKTYEGFRVSFNNHDCDVKKRILKRAAMFGCLFFCPKNGICWESGQNQAGSPRIAFFEAFFVAHMRHG